MKTGRTPRQVIGEVVDQATDGGYGRLSMTDAIRDALDDEGWLRTPGERLSAVLDTGAGQPLTLGQVRDGTGFVPGTLFIPVPPR